MSNVDFRCIGYCIVTLFNVDCGQSIFVLQSRLKCYNSVRYLLVKILYNLGNNIVHVTSWAETTGLSRHATNSVVY